MPILGRSGESVGQRLFGNRGVGQGIKNLVTGTTSLGGRVIKGIVTPGGILGKQASASTLGAEAQKFKNDIEANDRDERNANTNEETQQLQTGGNGPSDIYAPGKFNGSSISSADREKIANIGKGWDNMGDEFKATDKSLKSSKNYISNLGKIRDRYLNSIEEYKKKTDTAIAGNKALIEENQKKDLDVLAGDTRKSMDNTNVMLGVKGASGGSASRAASRAIASSAGRARAGVLTARGDQISEQNQASENALEDYNTKRAQAYEWEKTAAKEAMEEFKSQQEALDRLKKNSSDWKEEDIKAESDNNLQKLMSSLFTIQSQAKNFRDNLAAKMTEYGGLADELDIAAVGVDAPAELDTPEFSENIDLTDPNNATDWYDPNNTGKPARVIKGYDALGNPIYDDTVLADQVVTA